jgi:hypothetical protein
MRPSEELRALAYLERGWTSRRIRQADVERFMLARLRVSVVVPLLERPTIRTRVMTGMELLDYMKSHGGTCAEFIVGVSPVKVQTSARRR